jgi:hypothetical protein
MPVDWENNIVHKISHTKTRFTSVSIDEASTCHKVGTFSLFWFYLFSSSENTHQEKVVTKPFWLLNQLEAHVHHILLCK